MVHSVMRKEIITLGRLLVASLGEKSNADIISQWMAHYIAEQIVFCETAKGDEKKEAEQRCFDTILKLWQHRFSLPDGRRPFENFEPILRTLDSLDPENEHSFYKFFVPDQSSLDNPPEDIGDEVQSWLDTALRIDRAARVLISFSLKQAADVATDEDTADWINNSINLTDDDDEVSIILHLVSADITAPEKVEKEKSDQMKKHKIEVLQSKIEKLDALVESSHSLRAALTDEIEKISLENNQYKK